MNDAPGLKRILIFDDDSDFRKLLLLRLGKMFANVELEEYDPIARGIPDVDFDWSRYDVLLLDYYLCIHGVTGLDILRKNRKNPQFPATIMLTGAGNEEIAVRALKSGVSDYIRKETLDKEALRKSILNAYEESKLHRQRANEATLHGHAFNKALFYQQLELSDIDENKRILLLIQLDGHERLATGTGIIIRDNIVRHIAKQSFEVFQIGDCNPSITRFSEVSIALLIDDPDSRSTLEFNLAGLCNHLRKRPYKFDGKKFRYTVSIGVVALATSHRTVDTITKIAKQAVESAAATRGENSYKIYDASQAVTEAVEEQVTPETSATPGTDDNDEVSTTIDEAPAEAANAISADTKAMVADVSEELELSTTIPNEVTIAQKDESNAVTEAARAPAPGPEPELEPAPAPVLEAKPKPAPAPPKTTVKATPPAEEKKSKPRESDEAILKPAPAPATVLEAKPKPAPAPPKTTVKATPPAEEKKPKPRESDEAILNEATLNIAALELKRSFEEKLVVHTFQPVISMLAEEEAYASELYVTSFQLINTDGSIVAAEEILSRVADIPAFQKYIDRWMLREAIGRAVHSSLDRYVFLMKISDASIADATLFNWLRELLSGLGTRHPGRAVALEISAETFSARQKQAEALMTYLHKLHGFKFMLAHVEDVETMKKLTKKTNFDFLNVSPKMIKQLAEAGSGDAEAGGTLLASLKKRGAGIVVKNVEDATTLTEVISLGADYAIGEFIGEASTQLDDMTNVESFEIS